MRQQNAIMVQEQQSLQTRLNWPVLEDLVLLRLLFGPNEGETEVQLRKDLHPFVMQLMSASDWRTTLGQIIVTLVDQGFIRPVRANAYLHNQQCEPRALEFLQLTRLPKAAWHEVRDGYIIALALNLKPTSQLVARLLSAEGLRSVLLTKTFDLPFDIISVTPEQIRFGLAKLAETRGLTSGIRTTPITQNDITQREAVMMASKLLKSRHVVESDGELMACLSAEVVGAVNESAQELRQMLFRQLISSKESSQVISKEGGQSRGSESITQAPPSLPEFTQQVLDIAKDIAVGWPGNKRAFISHIWRQLCQKFPHWQLDEEAYKEMILNAHRAGLLRLAIADLRDKTNMEDVAQSRIEYKNSEWHFIRVDD